MTTLDWIVLGCTMAFIVGYGSWKTRQNKNMRDYLLGNKEAQWFTVALSIMATQASAITFLSAPGQAYTDGMRFVQFYFGLPIAMVVLCVAVVPLYYRLEVFTAYEFLEKRFDLRTRLLAAILFLTQRGLAAGFTIFAPSLVLSSLLGWNIYWTNLAIGLMVIAYTVTGGSKAVNVTQKYQMAIIFIGMLLAGVLVVRFLPEEVSFTDALYIAGSMEKLNVVDFDFDPTSRYNIWTGLIGGFFLALSYFGTDQSQVARYLSGSSIAQSRLGLLFNGMIKIPMQFLILFIGAMVYVFYLFNAPPVFFNKVLLDETRLKDPARFEVLEGQFLQQHEEQKNAAVNLARALQTGDPTQKDMAVTALKSAHSQTMEVRKETISTIKAVRPNADTNDTNYIFLTFVRDFLPAGLVGLLIAVILSASMSSTSSELNALASTTVVDIYKRLVNQQATELHYVAASRWATVFWGLYAIGFSMFANRLGTLIEAVNILGSLVYGTILGIFLVAFFFKRVGGQATFIAALIAETLVLWCYFYTEIPFLWYNVIGCLPVIGLGLLFQRWKDR